MAVREKPTFSDRTQSATPGPSPQNLSSMLRRWAIETPDALALAFVSDDLSVQRSLTYRELDQAARCIAAVLASHAQPGDRALLLFAPGLDFTISFFACMYAGLVAVPAPAPDKVRLKNSAPRLRIIAEDARCAVVLSTRELHDAAKALELDSPALATWISTDNIDLTGAELEPVEPAPSDLAYLQYTSGSTSSPRGAMITHGNAVANCRSTSVPFAPDSNSRSLSWLPQFHDYGLIHGTLWPLYAGIPAYLMSPVTFLRRPLRWLEAIAHFRITHTGAPNFAYASCVQAVERMPSWRADLSTLVVTGCGAEPINPETVTRFAETFEAHGYSPSAFTPGYGLAESTLVASIKAHGQMPRVFTVSSSRLLEGVAEPATDPADSRTLIGSGEQLPETEIALVNIDTGTRVGENKIGEVWLAGASIATGYWNNENATQASFNQHLPGEPGREYLRTGDLGFMHEGELYITGRLKDLVIFHGRNFYPHDIEWTAERASPALRAGHCAAFSIDTPDGEQLVVAAEVERRMHNSDLGAIAHSIRREVAREHAVPIHTVALLRAGIPRTSSGKIRRQSCKQEFLAGTLDVLLSDARQHTGSGAERSSLTLDQITRLQPKEHIAALEQFLAAEVAWLQDAAADSIDLDGSVIENGLDSLTTMRLLQEIEQRFGVVISAAQVFDGRSLRAVAGTIVEGLGKGTTNARTLGWILNAEPARTLQKLPASAAQEAVWFVEKLAERTNLYALAEAVRFEGKLDLQVLQDSLGALIARHGSLRTSFEEHNGMPLQVVHPVADVALPISVEDCTESALAELIEKSLEQPFDLSRSPLLRVQVFRLAETSHVLLLQIHHLITDGMSMSLFARELGELYAAKTRGREPKLPATADYADYSRWQRDLANTPGYQQQLDYWRKRLENLQPLNLPTDRPRPARNRFHGGMIRFQIDTARVAQLKSLARAENATLFVVLLAAFKALMQRYTGQSDITVGSPTAGRFRAEFQNILGFFTNTLVLRTDLSGSPTFAQLVSRVRETALGAYANQEVPSDRLIGELGLVRDLSRNPLYPVAFALQSMPDTTLTLDGVRSTLIPLHAGTAKSDLWLALTEVNGVLQGELEYNADLFEADTVRQIANHYSTLLAQVVGAPSKPIEQFSILSEADRQQLLVGWNDTAKDYPLQMCLPELVEAQVAKHPNAIAVSFEKLTLTYTELNERANRLARHLVAAGVRRDSLIAVCMDRSLDLAIALLATLKAGGAFLPLDPEYPAERLSFMLEDSGAGVILTHGQLREQLTRLAPALQTQIIAVDAQSDAFAQYSDANLTLALSPDDLAYAIYTSGSTGRPKCALVHHRALCNHLHWLVETFDVSEHDHFLQKTTISFDASIQEFFVPWITGALLVMAPPGAHRDTQQMVRVLRESQITFLQMVPSALAALAHEPELKECTSLRQITCGGEALDPELAREIFRRLPQVSLRNLYGPTEAADDVTSFDPRDEAVTSATSVPIGRPIANMRCLVLDARMELVPIGVIGELYLGGIGVGRGYLNRPELTAERFPNDPFRPGERLYRTGDLARYTRNGVIEFLGRLDHQVKIRGFRIEIGEIEAALNALRGITESAVVVREDAPGIKRLVAYLVGANPSVTDLNAELKRRLPAYMVPSVIMPLRALPRLPNGKLDRKALPAPQGPTAGAEHVEPRSALEETLAQIWSAVLGVPHVGVHDDFFQLGGHSLLATQVMARIRGVFGVNLPLRTLFEAPTIAGLAQQIHLADPAVSRTIRLPIPPSMQSGPVRLSAAQESLWFLDRLRGASGLYNIPWAAKLTGALNVDALERSLQALVDRHESLRTSFEEQGGVPLQVVSPKATLVLERLTVEVSQTDRRQDVVQRLLVEATRRVFDLSRAPLISATLARISEREHLLLLVIHHIVADGWSMGVITRELTEFYRAYSTNTPVGLADLPLQFKDYAEWERNRLLGSRSIKKHLAYWRDQLRGLEPIRLPTDSVRPAQMTFRGGVEQRSLSEQTLVELRALAGQQNATLHMVLLAAFKMLLMRWSGSEDVSVGTPVAGRDRVEVEGLIGCLVNTLVLRTDLSGNPSFAELVERIRQMALAGYSHQDMPFDRLVAELSPVREFNQNPLFDVLVNYTEGLAESFTLADLAVQPLIPRSISAKFAMTLYVSVRPHSLDFSLVYQSELYSAARMAALMNQLLSLLEQVATEPHLSIGDYSLVTADSRSLLPDPSAQIPSPLQPLVTDRVKHWARNEPRRVAVSMGGKNWTYADLVSRSRTICQAIRARGLGAGVVVAVQAPRGFDLVSALLGVMTSGCAFLTIDPALPEARRTLMIEQSGAKLLCLGAGSSTSELGIETIELATISEFAATRADASPVEIDPRGPAYVFFTSGSTGRPKAVLGTHNGLSHFLHWQAARFQIGPNDRVSQLIGLSFDPMLRDIFLPLISGAALCIPEDADVLDPLAWFRREGITAVHTTPTLLQIWLLNAQRVNELPALRWMFISGEPLTDTLVARWRRQVASPASLVNLYGPTETTLAKCYYVVPNEVAAGVQPVGTPIPGCQVLVLTSSGQPCGVGETGELVLRTPFRSLGYLNQPQETRQAFRPNPFRDDPDDLLYFSGDRGRYRPDGLIEIAGRSDDQVKIHGVRVEPAEVMATLARHPALRMCAVTARKNNDDQYRLVAYVVCDPKTAVDASQLRLFLESQIAPAFVPSAFVFLQTLPLLPNGKVDRRSLPPPSDDLATNEYVGPRTPVETRLQEIWHDVLNCPPPGIHDDFFQLGGHSLLATQVISRVRGTLGADLPLRTVFEARTIARLAELVEPLAGPLANASRGDSPIEAQLRNRPLPLSFSQQRMWFVQLREPEGTAYNMPFAVRMRGELDLNALTRSLEALVARHEAFRTTFTVMGGEPAQIVSSVTDTSVQTADLRHLPEADRVAEAARLFREQAMRPFDLSKGPLYRIVVARIGDRDHALLMLMHHAIGDQWSAGIVASDLSRLYNAFTRGQTAELQPLPVQYADYATWQREHLSGKALQEQLEYWRTKLRDVPVLALPTDRPRPAQRRFHGSQVVAPIPPHTLAALKRLSSTSGATAFMTLLACFKLLLHRYTNQEDIAIGAPIANRTRMETEHLIGTLVNTLVMRTSLEGDPTFSGLLSRVRETALEAYAHQDLPFERLVEELADRSVSDHAPLVQVLFNVANAPLRHIGLDGIELDLFEFDRGSAQFDLAMSVDPDRLGRLAISYSTEVYERETARQMLAHFLGLLEQVTSNPDKPLSAYSVITAEERAIMLGHWNRTASSYPESQRVDQLVAVQARRLPHVVAMAMATGNRRMTYAELDSAANQLAHLLRRRGVGAESLVGVCLERSPDMVVALLAVMKSGGAYVPLDPAFPRDRIHMMVEDAGLAFILTETSVSGLLPDMPDKTLCIDTARAQIAAEPRHDPGHVGSPLDLAYILYTSGSTGKPKGVEISHRALVNFLCSMRRTPGCVETDSLLAVTTLSFDISGLELYLPLIVGARIEIASRRESSDGRLLRQRIEQTRPTLMQATPATWRMLIEAGWKGSDNLSILCGGEPLPRDLASQLLDRCKALWNMYGPTETTIWSTLDRVERDAEITIGRPIANTSIFILDKHRQPVPAGVTGELYIGGDGLARGYRNRTELTAEKFVTSPFASAGSRRLYATGDLARFRPDGRIVHLGRIDSQVKIRGFRIELGEVQAALMGHDQIAQAVVAAKDDSSGLKQLVGYIIARGDEKPAAADLRTFLRTTLPDYMVPSNFIYMDEFPLTANRKIDVKALPAPSAPQATPLAPKVEPRGRLEVQLTVLWRQVLGNDNIGVHDNFFDNGGHSLKAVQLLSSLESVTGRQLPLATIFEAPTIAQMAQLLERAQWQPSWRSLVAVQPNGEAVPIFAVPGVGGNVLMFAKLSKLLGATQPFYGLQARGLDNTEAPFTSIPKMAAHYCSEIRSLRAKGPYVIVGTCTGGVIAYEMAQQLRGAGEEVVLSILESWHPKTARGPHWSMTALWPLFFVLDKVRSYARTLLRTPVREWPDFFASKAKLLKGMVSGASDDPTTASSYHPSLVVQATWRAVSSYVPGSYAGKLLNVVAERRVIRSGVVDTRLEWESLARGPNEHASIPAIDSGQMFVSPNVEMLASKLGSYLVAELSPARGAATPVTRSDLAA
jgi:amino acid adenylation domain-containing protein